MKHLYILVATLCLLGSCQSLKKTSDSKYLRWVGDIAFDPTLDDASFVVCNEEKAKQYHNFSKGMQYRGEKHALIKVFTEKYQAPKDSKETGLIRIRFIVNCKGETGRFRVQGMSEDYQEHKFDPKITIQLQRLTKSLVGWMRRPNDDNAEDYYQYLIFKINKGQLIEIMP